VRGLGREWTALGSAALSALSRLFAYEDLGVAEAVAALKGDEATSLLIGGLKSTEPEFAEFCARSLGERRAAGAKAALEDAFTRPEVGVRFEAYMALRSISQRTTN
jgi:hypothetical protein